MEPKFTKGPWSRGRLLITRNTERWSAEEKELADRIERLRVFAYFRADDEGRSRVLVATCQNEDDARLIAAAPELYEALEAVKEYSKEHGFFDADVITQAIQALRKARGEV